MLFQRILRRIVLTLIVIIGVTIIAFVLVRLTPGDPAAQMLPVTANREQIAAMHERMGLDRPLIFQYFLYTSNLLRGDLGYSYHFKADCSTLIFTRFSKTAEITFIGIALAFLVSIPLGLIAGIKKKSNVDVIAMGFALCGQAMSPVWLCLLLILIFSVWLGWLPTQGTGTWKHLVMPSICVGFSFCSLVTRMLRSGIIDVLQEDYITAIRARGISAFRIYVKYAFKNAVLPIVTISGAQLGILLTGSMVIEQVFSWPGLGQLTMVAIFSRDFQLVQSILLVIALIMVFCNLLVDILYTFIDKRISFN
jgi:ABC-type dipeptide/oligopeptide/nickel transport system permease component